MKNHSRTLICKKCGHQWLKRVKQPLRCPLCQTQYWSTFPIKKRKGLVSK